MVSKVKNIIGVLIGIFIIIFLYQKFFPNVIVKTKYIKGKTDTVRIIRDSLIYITKYIPKTDTFYVDTTGEHASAHFNLQNSVTGVVNYDTPDFSFHNVKIKQKIITNYLTRIDTLKIIRTIRDRKSTRLNSSHIPLSRMPSSA